MTRTSKISLNCSFHLGLSVCGFTDVVRMNFAGSVSEMLLLRILSLRFRDAPSFLRPPWRLGLPLMLPDPSSSSELFRLSRVLPGWMPSMQ
ncbi:unnamed protein product [Larinioides sclopetarius]|uniref:Uncharacterized protein n=1 Tax=Larinioides sclopetarius TaxID=280406 RepID=A0AAV1ZFM6_9ARAC